MTFIGGWSAHIKSNKSVACMMAAPGVAEAEAGAWAQAAAAAAAAAGRRSQPTDISLLFPSNLLY